MAAVAPLALEIEHVGRSVHGHEDRVAPADRDGALRVAGVHGVFGGDLADQLHELGAIDPHPVAIDRRAGLAPHGDRLVVAELDADFLEDLAGFVVDELDRFVRHDVVERDAALEHRERRDGCGPQLPPSFAPAGPPGGRGGDRSGIDQFLDVHHGDILAGSATLHAGNVACVNFSGPVNHDRSPCHRWRQGR